MSDSSRLDTIEIKLAHLEHALEQLGDALIRQQRDIEALQLHNRHLKQQLQVIEAAAGSTGDGFEKPPHY